MQKAASLKEYRKELREALEQPFQRKSLDNFAVAYRESRSRSFDGLDLEGIIEDIAAVKDKGLAQMDELYERFKSQAEKKGIQVHLAGSDREANQIIASIARENGCRKIVKSKSMTAEETLLNHFLEDRGLEVVETDLGEWIIQLRNEGPSHMVMPAIHLSRKEVSDIFSKVTGRDQGTDIENLVKVARRELRQRFVQADMGISGANFALADSATIGIVTNEGNGRLVTTLPRVHVALIGMDKLVPSLYDALTILKGLPRNATAQAISSYVTWITGANECKSSPHGKKIMHIVFLDNGRRAMARDPVFSQALRCVRCGACSNVCPVYRLVGGHKYGHIYIGAIGLILTYFFHGREKDKNLVQNCLNCQACRHVCIAGIDLPKLIKEVQAVIEGGQRRPALNVLTAQVLKNRKLFHALLRSARYAQQPVSAGSPYLRHLPMFLLKDHGFKKIPALASKPFRDRFSQIKPKVQNPAYKIALFSGCLQDFVYPQQLEDCMKLLQGREIEVDFPKGQGCCGLPVLMLGEKEAASEVAKHNIHSLEPSEYDYILTLCASCGSHLKENYPFLLGDHSGLGVKVKQFTDKVIDVSSFLDRIVGLPPSGLHSGGLKFAYHAPCHLCRGLKIRQGPRELMQRAGYEYIPNSEEEVCCGLGGTFSIKFPEISSELATKKLDISDNKAEILVTDCPGCVMQLRGTAQKQSKDLEVMHIVQALKKRYVP